MNNGKVRIYELSKELNLDNREILDVCEQLNIPVKSHSSTISEAEAAQIRSAAAKIIQNPSPSSGKPTSSSHSSMTQPKKGLSQPPVKKQQILEVRRHRSTAEPPKRPEAPAPSAPAPEATAAPTPARPASVEPPSRPASPNRPIKAQPAEPMAEPAAAVQPAPQHSTPEPEKKPISITETEPEAPSLVGPPVKPVVRRETPSGVNRPILRKAEPPIRKSTAARAAGDGSRSNAPSGRISITEVDEPPTRREKPVIELRRRPTRPSEAEEGASGTNPAINIVPEVELKRPERPIPAKAVKRGKDWEEEDDEREGAKAGKVAPKGKRRTVVVEEEDLDLDDLLDGDQDDESSASMVSLSLARPPKPKGRPIAAKPAASAPARKKPSGPSESRYQRRERREQEASKQRPELITLTGGLSVAELAEQLVVPDTEIIKTLFTKGIMTSVNQILDIPTATIVAEELGVLVDTAAQEAEAKKVTEMISADDLQHLQRRPPVVTIMGHVDHGKTTLLDSIRKTKVAQGEAGGITQHIGAYHVDVEHNGKSEQVVFLDTPGHEAFTAMRARGARVTDIAVLVVAADDGVRPQTIEAISHAKAAEVPVVVAINKVDKEEANPDRVKQELMEHNLVPEEWGGDTIMVPVSALTGDNLDNLLEMLLLVAEVEDLHANPDRPARGTVIEANLDKSKGPVATLLVQNGTLRVGDVLVAGSVFGKVRAMIDDRGHRVDSVSPSFAVEVLGLSDVPAAGDEFEVYREEKEARSIADKRMDQQRQSRLQQAMASRRVSLNTLSAQAQEGDLKELNLVLKADVQGSVEAILGALQQLPQKEVQVRVLLAAPGEITETDVDLAAASNAVIVGFNTTFASGARKAADEADVDVRDYTIIYNLLDDVQGAMEGLLDPELVEEPLGEVEVRAVFKVGNGTVAGCYVKSGKAIRNCKIRVRRGGQEIFSGTLDSLKRMKDDVKEVNAGYECGLGCDDFKDWQEGDMVETYRLATKRRTLSA
ncbi:translation initiation factor IF-2 [Leptolyngbya sp. AN02str]|uniref:translation initiation factor IF-2 n=1 Tax=Leptolyngbya sp. AN02str TaxID=3423363 RepID=UPI003D3176F4